jgi:hypothetical protein
MLLPNLSRIDAISVTSLASCSSTACTSATTPSKKDVRMQERLASTDNSGRERGQNYPKYHTILLSSFNISSEETSLALPARVVGAIL